MNMEDHLEPTPQDTVNEPSLSRLSSTFATAEIPPDISDGTPLNDADNELEEIAASSSSSSRRHSATTEGFLDDGLQNSDGQIGAKSASSRSSLSSIPDSVVVHSKEQHASYGRDSIGTAYGEQEYINYNNPALYQKIRDRNSPFRHPSSVKAMQMQTEDEEDEDYKSPSSRRRGAGFLGSPASVRSMGSPLVRRHGYHSAGGTPRKSPVKRENPLVLLHCTILPPTVVLAPGVCLPDRKILEKVLPPQYWRRWKLLEEKIIASSLLRDRGLLIQHPQEDYGLLEERVLESLELQRPRLQNGHYIDREASDSESETAQDKAPTHKDEEDKRLCADCGCHVNRHDDQQKWDVKFYAANGLMKEGAWTAAWKEIERVDVQVSLWLPYEVKNEVERKIREENLLLVDQQLQQERDIKAAQPIINEPEHGLLSQDQIDGLDDDPKPHTSRPSRRDVSGLAYPTPATVENPQDIDLHTLVINSLRVLASDRRKVVTAASMLIAVLAVVFGGRLSRRTHYGSEVVQLGNFPAVSTQVYYTSSSSCVLTQSSTEIPLLETENGMERPREIQRVAQGVREGDPAGHSVRDTVQSVGQQQVEPIIKILDPNATENSSSEPQMELSESIHIDQTIIEPKETLSIETVEPHTPSPSSTLEFDMVVDNISSVENKMDTEPSSEVHPATAQNDHDEAT